MDFLRIGVIGAAGFIGKDHINRINKSISRAEVTAVSDIFEEKVMQVAEMYDAESFLDGKELINSSKVDAVLIASSDDTHAEYVLESISAGKPVFCEKPLASNYDDCVKILNAESEHGKKIVQVGFMRRYDPGYREMKEILNEEKFGKPLLIHCKSRTPITPPGHTTSMHATNVVVHEIDIIRWLLDDEFNKVQVVFPRSTIHAPSGLKDPQLMILQTQKGVVVNVEVAVNSHYGYEILCEIVCENGTIILPQPSRVRTKIHHNYSETIMNDWSKRFVEAYDIELQEWVDSCLDNTPFLAANSWDGYVAYAVGEKLVKSQETKLFEDVILDNKPELYL